MIMNKLLKFILSVSIFAIMPALTSCDDGFIYCTVRDYRVIRHAETPGLGAKMEQWFRDPSGARSVIGRNPSIESFTVSKDGGAVDAITAATISSRAFLQTLRDAYMAYREYAAENGIQLAEVKK